MNKKCFAYTGTSSRVVSKIYRLIALITHLSTHNEAREKFMTLQDVGFVNMELMIDKNLMLHWF